MTEHGWPDHHDDPGYHDDHHDPLHDPLPDDGPHDVDPPSDDDHGFWEVHHEDVVAPEDVHHEDVVYEQHVEPVETHEVAADPDAQPEYDATDSVFPPAVDVGPLPEPVDGFPWIDTGSLGVADIHEAAPLEPVDPHELAEYAGADLPPGVDPWAALADSEDPATSALARWWSQQQ